MRGVSKEQKQLLHHWLPLKKRLRLHRCFHLNVWAGGSSLAEHQQAQRIMSVAQIAEMRLCYCVEMGWFWNIYFLCSTNSRATWWQRELDQNTWRNSRIPNGKPMQNVMRTWWSTGYPGDCWNKHTTPGFGASGEVTQSLVVNLHLGAEVRSNPCSWRRKLPLHKDLWRKRLRLRDLKTTNPSMREKPYRPPL